MQIAFLLLLVPLLWIIFAKLRYKHEYTGKEALIQLGTSVVSSFALAGLTYLLLHSQAMDHEYLNGQVTDKYRDRVSCSHAYQVCTGSSKSRVCTTYHEHSADYNWVVKTTVGNLTIDRVNRQGTTEPDRFTEVVIGEPATLSHSYQNYVKASPASLFNDSEFKNLAHNHQVPEYPETYDYYRMNRIVIDGVNIPNEDAVKLNKSLNEHLRVLGSKKEVNIIIVLTNNPSMEYATAIKYKWLGGKKNDVVVVMSMENYPQVDWTKSFGWSKNNMVYVAMNDAFSGKPLIAETAGDKIAQIVDEHYHRRPFDEFKYLMDELEPPMWSIILAFILNIILTLGIGIYFVRNDVA